MFQAYRTLYSPISLSEVSPRTLLMFLLKYPTFRVPCAPARSDFSTALKDLEKAKKNGYYAQILVVEGEK